MMVVFYLLDIVVLFIGRPRNVLSAPQIVIYGYGCILRRLLHTYFVGISTRPLLDNLLDVGGTEARW